VKPLQWNKGSTRAKPHCYGKRGWTSRQPFAFPAEGEKCFLTSPFIEQAFSPITPKSGIPAFADEIAIQIAVASDPYHALSAAPAMQTSL